MSDFLQIFAVILAAVAMVPAVAHLLELPGKMRLGKDAYFAVQRIYYPGFTIAGVSEPLAIAATAALLAFTPSRDLAFWLIVAALLGLAAMQAVYWIVTHTVNKQWLRNEHLGAAGQRFFSVQSAKSAESGMEQWQALRNRWEYSHAVRAALAFVSFTFLVISTVSE
jgi:hypothetical protein